MGFQILLAFEAFLISFASYLLLWYGEILNFPMFHTRK